MAVPVYLAPGSERLTARVAAAIVLAGAVATVAGALFFEHGLSLLPCKLCLVQRNPYYGAIPVLLLALVLPSAGKSARVALAAVALIFLVSAGLGLYHSGVEWGWWAGPSDCGGGGGATATTGDLLQSLARTQVVSCAEAAWRLAGLSLAGWNALISLALAAVAAFGALSRPSSSI